MAQAPRPLTPWQSHRHLFGAELRQWRTIRGLSQQALSQLTFDSPSQIAKIEKAVRWPSSEMVARLDAALNTDGALLRMWHGRPVDSTYTDSEVIAGDGALVEFALAWHPEVRDTVSAVTELWRGDMQRRDVLVAAAFTAVGVTEPARQWLAQATDAHAASIGRRRVGAAEVEAAWAMCAAFADTDHKLGGGYARSTLVHYLDATIAPMLAGTYDTATGRQLYAAIGRLCGLAGFMSFDTGMHGLAQRYLVQALRLAKAAGDRALGAHILADMSMQAHHLGHPAEALAFADTGVRTATDCGSPSTAARCHALRARAHALAGDPTGSDTAMRAAEHCLERAHTDEPSWIRFFTADQLAAEHMYVAADLHRPARIRHHAAVLADTPGMQRRRVLTSAALACSYLPDPATRRTDRYVDIDAACAVLRDAISAATGLTSSRGLAAINTARLRLAPHAQRPATRLVEDEFQQLVAAGWAST